MWMKKGCRSVFSCCSYGAYVGTGKCPNIRCCEEKGLDGCYECNEIMSCTKGFYTPDNDGAAASKAQALFIKKYGKEAFLKAHDTLHQKYSFEKTQEILGQNVEEGLRILEESMNCAGNDGNE